MCSSWLLANEFAENILIEDYYLLCLLMEPMAQMGQNPLFGGAAAHLSYLTP